jgi:hypothetical protein
MAEPTFIGRVYIHGLDGTLAYTGMATTANELKSLSYRDRITRANTKDKKGETVGVRLWDPNPMVSVRFLVCEPMGAGSIANAKTRMVLPSKGAKVTLAGFPPAVGTAEGTINSVSWIYFGDGEIEFTDEGEVAMTLPLEKFNTDLAATANS